MNSFHRNATFPNQNDNRGILSNNFNILQKNNQDMDYMFQKMPNIKNNSQYNPEFSEPFDIKLDAIQTKTSFPLQSFQNQYNYPKKSTNNRATEKAKFEQSPNQRIQNLSKVDVYSDRTSRAFNTIQEIFPSSSQPSTSKYSCDRSKTNNPLLLENSQNNFFFPQPGSSRSFNDNRNASNQFHMNGPNDFFLPQPGTSKYFNDSRYAFDQFQVKGQNNLISPQPGTSFNDSGNASKQFQIKGQRNYFLTQSNNLFPNKKLRTGETHLKSFGIDDSFPNKIIKTEETKPFSTRKPYKTNKVEKRFYIGSIGQVIHWHQLAKEANIFAFYQVSATIVSVKNGKSLCTHNLLLKDENGSDSSTLQAVFYSIDRNLPDVQPGQFTTFVGRMVGARKFQVFDMWPTTLKEQAGIRRISFLCQRTLQEASLLSKTSKLTSTD
uniref:Uncharacterized protein n=1 Tax=Clastoptera arizonana TaxID=38151 RepID=A0A1B6D8T8_9HEMI